MPDPPLYTSIDPWKKHIRNIDSARALKDDRDAHNQTSLNHRTRPYTKNTSLTPENVKMQNQGKLQAEENILYSDFPLSSHDTKMIFQSFYREEKTANLEF